MGKKGSANIDRMSSALKMRKAGSTFKEIGAALGVTPARASEIVKTAERLIRVADYDAAMRSKDYSGKKLSDIPMEDFLWFSSSRLHNCLITLGLHSGTIGDLLAVPDEVLLKGQNFGIKTLEELKLIVVAFERRVYDCRQEIRCDSSPL